MHECKLCQSVMAYNKTEWINVLDINQSLFSWTFRKYQCPQYIFAEKYDLDSIKQKILNSHRIKDAVEQVMYDSVFTAYCNFFLMLHNILSFSDVFRGYRIITLGRNS